MNIKSLILGSATVALATAGAQAADAIVIAEPEPVEYVRVCDVYGAGFFYIPGTETCLRIGAEIRHQLGTAGDSDIGVFAGPARLTHGNYNNLAADTTTSHSRVRLYMDARSETEYGQLRGYFRIDSGRTAGAAGGIAVDTSTLGYAISDGTYLNHAWLSLGGFRAGWTDSAWVSTPHGGRAAGGSHSDNGFFYGYHQAHLVQYNFSGSNGFFGTISLEDDNRAGTNYTPDIVGVVGINQGWGAAWLKVGYDETYNTAGDSGFGVTAGLHYNIAAAPGSSFRLIGYYADSDNKYNPLFNTGLSTWDANGPLFAGGLAGGPEWSILASYHHQFNTQFGASLAVQYFNDFYAAGTDFNTGLDGWALEFAGVWTPVENFTVRTEVIYSDFDTVAGSGISGDSISGFVRFSRFF